jgi:hypothetical protein
VERNNRIIWNGKQVSLEQLSAYSSMLPQMNPIPFTILQIDNGASCEVVREIRQTINDRAKCNGEYGSSCGEGSQPWARIGDVIGPNGESYKIFPDGRVVTIQPTAEARSHLQAVRNEIDTIAEEAKKARKK